MYKKLHLPDRSLLLMKFLVFSDGLSLYAIDGRQIARELVLYAFPVCHLRDPLLVKRRHHELPNLGNQFRDL